MIKNVEMTRLIIALDVETSLETSYETSCNIMIRIVQFLEENKKIVSMYFRVHSLTTLNGGTNYKTISNIMIGIFQFLEGKKRLFLETIL